MTAAPPPVVSAAIRQFGDDPGRAGKALRDAFNEDSDDFLRMVIRSTDLDPSDKGLRYALMLLRNNGALIPAIADPKVTDMTQALALSRGALAMDAAFINSLLDAVQARSDLNRTDCILRVLEVINQCSANVANWRSITRLFQSADPKVRSKCASILVRYRFDERSVGAWFGESDSRVRANVVEALSELDLSKAGWLLEQALTDQNNRVRGNACLALYNKGDARSLGLIAEMFHSREPQFRLTAAWVMGETRDIRFAGRLAQAAKASEARLRASASRALMNLNSTPRGEMSDSISVETASAATQAGSTEIWVRVLDSRGAFMPDVRPIDFYVSSGADFFLDYLVERVTGAADVGLRIAYPAGDVAFERALRDSLSEKLPGQPWAVGCYGIASLERLHTTGIAFRRDASEIGAMIDGGMPGTLGAVRICRTLLRLESSAAAQHFVMVAEPSLPASEMEAIRASCREKGVIFHRIAPAREAPDTAEGWRRLARALHDRYSIRVRGNVRSGDVAIRDVSASPARFSGAAGFSTGEGE